MLDSTIGCDVLGVNKIDDAARLKKTRLTFKKVLKNTKQSVVKFCQKCRQKCVTKSEMRSEIIFFYVYE